jgi:signal transduction histidine kinase/CheY-like chemotaxis protein
MTYNRNLNVNETLHINKGLSLAQEKTTESNSYLNKMHLYLNDYYGVFSLADVKIIESNTALKNAFNLKNNTWLSLVHDNEKEQASKYLEKLQQEEITLTITCYCLFIDGNYRLISWSMHSHDGLIYAVGRDIHNFILTLWKNKVNSTQPEDDKRLQNTRDFLNYMCHEVRNPLNGVTMSLNELSSIVDTIKPSLEPRVYAKLNELASDGMFCAAQIEEVVSDQLDIAKIESGMASINNTIINISDLINQALKVINTTIKKNNLKIEISHANSELLFKADRRLLLKVLINLLTNSAKFTDKGKIGINTEILEDKTSTASILINVIDTGIGISEEGLSNLFQKFNQKHKNTNKDYGGSGLGLCITKSIVEDVMQGKIEVQSSLGKGSSFKIFLTLVKPTAEEIEQYKKIIAPQPNSRQIDSGKKHLRILLAEDNIINQKLITNMLTKLGYETVLAENGKIAVEKYIAKHNTIDIILMDIVMPEMNGLESTVQIREFEKQKQINFCPIIGLSGNSSIKDRQLAEQAGMNDYLTKPINKKMLLKMISHNFYLSNPASAAQIETELSLYHKKIDTHFRNASISDNKNATPSSLESETGWPDETKEETPHLIKKGNDGNPSKRAISKVRFFAEEFKIAPMPDNNIIIKQSKCCIIS